MTSSNFTAFFHSAVNSPRTASHFPAGPTLLGSFHSSYLNSCTRTCTFMLNWFTYFIHLYKHHFPVKRRRRRWCCVAVVFMPTVNTHMHLSGLAEGPTACRSGPDQQEPFLSSGSSDSTDALLCLLAWWRNNDVTHNYSAITGVVVDAVHLSHLCPQNAACTSHDIPVPEELHQSCQWVFYFASFCLWAVCSEGRAHDRPSFSLGSFEVSHIKTLQTDHFGIKRRKVRHLNTRTYEFSRVHVLAG